MVTKRALAASKRNTYLSMLRAFDREYALFKVAGNPVALDELQAQVKEIVSKQKAVGLKPRTASIKVLELLRKGPTSSADMVPTCLSQNAAVTLVNKLRKEGYEITCERQPNRQPGIYTLVSEP